MDHIATEFVRIAKEFCVKEEIDLVRIRYTTDYETMFESISRYKSLIEAEMKCPVRTGLTDDDGVYLFMIGDETIEFQLLEKNISL